MNNNKTLFIIVGPTASGKTDVAFQLALQLKTEIISADSRQIYIELGVGANKPPADYLDTIPHHFINHVSIFEKYTAGDYGEEARDLMAQLFKHHDFLIMVGGSGLYIHSAIYGLDPIPSVPSHMRHYLETLLITEGLDHLVNMLQEKDPYAIQIVDTKNPPRVIRALEVCLYTGKPYSQFLSSFRKEHPIVPYNIVWLGILEERHILYERINRRVDKMVFRGLIEEARLWYPYNHLYALRSHGYQEFFPFFAGRYSSQKAIELVKRNTRRYAKRQYTWFRRYPVKWLPREQIVPYALSLL